MRSLLVLSCLGGVLVPAVRAEPIVAVAPCGLTVRIHTPEDLAPWLRRDGNTLVLDHPRTGRVALIDGVDDHRLPRTDLSSFQPYPPEQIERALAGLHTLSVDLTVDVFILPTPPAATLESYAVCDAILLSPGCGPVPDAAAARLIVHELGHVLTWAYVDRRPGVWRDYLALRGLDALRNGPRAAHRDRAREILAEDIRDLFGGPLATAGGGIENPDRPAPDRVAGLVDFLTGVIHAEPSASSSVVRVYPNPCNPRATLELQLPAGAGTDGGSIVGEILDLRGRRVRRLAGGRLENGRAALVWDGRDDAGAEAPSGRYLFRLTCGTRWGTGRLTMIR